MKKTLSFLIALALIISMNSCHQTTNEKSDTSLAQEVKNEFKRSWEGYKKYAWGHDVLKPITKTHSDWYAQSLHISPIDAYSTMKVMGLDKEADEVYQYILDSVNFDKDIFVKTFEVNIRILGGLLAMYQYTEDQKILDLAEDFGTRMLPAFESPTGMPYYWVNLKTGEVKGADINVAEGGSYTFEMGILSHFTENPVFYEKAKRATKAIFDRRSEIGLIGERTNVETGEWTDERSHIGCCIDSYYEYMYKSWLLFGDEELKEMWDISLEAINKYIAENYNGNLWYAQVNMNTGEVMNRIVTLYDAYFPGLLALNNDLERAEKNQASWNQLWNKNGLEPMVYDYGLDSITGPNYDLNPEIIESAWYLYEITGKEEYKQMLEKYFADLKLYCRNDVAYTSMQNVITKERKDYMPTFFFAETLKYLYLGLSDKGKEYQENYVFSTEAHPFRKELFVK
jgi:hypothetical protein